MIKLPPLRRMAQDFHLLRTTDDGELCFVREASAREDRLMAKIAANRSALAWVGDMLAVIHNDGGHYLFEHGMEKAIGDAVDKHYAMRLRIEELEAERDSWKTGSIHSCHDACPRIECMQRRRIARLETELLRASDTLLSKPPEG